MKNQVFNPYLPLDKYIPDGEPHVFGDRIYLFGSHDREGGDTFCALDYEFYSAPLDDLSDWSSKGINYRASQDALYSKDRPYLYAPDVVKGNDGKFYLYYCLAGYRGKGGYFGPISVAVCDSPDGKYEYLGFVRNPDGTPFNKYVCFDPAVINDGGVIRLYYGTAMPKGMFLSGTMRRISWRIFSKIYGKSKEEIISKPGVWGANMITLCDDMLTVKNDAVRIIQEKSKGTSFEKHAFFEGSSIRKIYDTYYFIYSSQKNHELCYATSKYPDRDFSFGGTIVSTGDVGFNGRKEKDRINTTGTTHGSIEKINNNWYVFYHRLTHGSDYSRQACAEQIKIESDGSIKQVQISSCGLNGKPLEAVGIYSAVIACGITNGKMPHISNCRYKKPIPTVTHENGERFIGNIGNGTTVIFRYFKFNSPSGKIRLDIDSQAEGELCIFADRELISKIKIQKCGRNAVETDYRISEAGAKTIQIKFKGKGIFSLYSIEYIP